LVYGAGLRLDKYLWFARLAPSRSHAQDLCESRRLRIDGRVVDRASALVRAGAVLSWPRGDEVIVVRVEGLPDRRGPYAEARDFYTDLTPARAPISADAAQGFQSRSQDALLPEAFALA
jgi:ribosome-associated heat shock protein Hsp15